MTNAASERPVQFGGADNLVGVLTEAAGPDAEKQAAHRPVMLFFNAGLLHRIGPHRIQVQLARRLASRGFSSLRFDLSGVGDSAPGPEHLPPLEAARADTSDAMDLLAADCGASTFVLMGLCRGAANAFEIACSDPRVTGLVLIDGYGFKTPQYYLRHYAPRLLSQKSWRSLVGRRKQVVQALMRRVRPRAGGDLIAAAETPAIPARYPRPPRAQIESNLRRLIARGVNLFVIYTSESECNYERQFMDSFPSIDWRGRLTLKYLPDMDHLFSARADQVWLGDAIERWLLTNDWE
jgi:pimeloyl-ACP methyl ester carboxylesterase